jgi:trimethylamine--corrinoid protein Co-methyltransferase
MANDLFQRKGLTPTDDDTAKIDRQSLRILAEIGVRVDDGPLRALGVKAGAVPAAGADRIRLPEKMVREYVALAPEEAKFADCAGKTVALAPGGEQTFWTGAALNYVRGRESRPITTGDLAEFARIADSLEGVFAVTGTSLEDVPPPARDFVGLRVLAEHTRKHLRPLLFDAANVQTMIEMAQVLAGGKPLADCPLISVGYSCISPLHWTQVACDLWRNSSGHRIPVMVNGEPLLGATSPVTLAGGLALSNAEILAGIVLVELLEPGRPVVHNLGFAHALDMRTAACLSGSGECVLLAAAGAKLAACYRLPSASWMGTDSPLDDEQAAMEKTLTGLVHALAGVNIIWGMGQLESQKALSPVQLVMDDQRVAAFGRLGRGFQVNDGTLAFEVVRQVVEGGGDFLAHEHTLAHFRQELSEARHLVRARRETWEADGGHGFAQRAAEHVRTVLRAPAPAPLTDQQRQDMLALERRQLARLGLPFG